MNVIPPDSSGLDRNIEKPQAGHLRHKFERNTHRDQSDVLYMMLLEGIHCSTFVIGPLVLGPVLIDISTDSHVMHTKINCVYTAFSL